MHRFIVWMIDIEGHLFPLFPGWGGVLGGWVYWGVFWGDASRRGGEGNDILLLTNTPWPPPSNNGLS